jgi:uncharacterized repeat protein (TIGR01451 family)
MHAMKRLLPLLLLWLLLGADSLNAKTEEAYQLTVEKMDQTGVVLELRLNDFTLEKRPYDGVTYHLVTVPGMQPISEPGQPQLPAVSRLLGTPPGGVTALRVLQAEYEVVTGIKPFPAPRLAADNPDEPPVEVFALDADVYRSEGSFPGKLAEVGMTGKLRHQPIVQVQLHPFQYRPAQEELRVYRRLRVQVLFAPNLNALAENTGISVTEPPIAYNQILEGALLNYDALPDAAPLRPSPQIHESAAQDGAPALKIFVDEDGLYRVTYPDIENAGFDLDSVDPRNLHLTTGGSEVAVHISGEDDGTFDLGDQLEFYGTAAVGEFTTRNVYWLRAGGSAGLRMPERDVAPFGGSPTATAFYATLHQEENHEYWPTMPDGEGKDHWFWERFSAAPQTSNYAFQLQNIAALGADGALRVRLHGRSYSNIDPDHRTQIRLNGVLVDDAWWDGEAPFTHTVSFSQTLLNDGVNTLTVEAPPVPATLNTIYVEDFEVGYWDTYTAEGDRLWFSAPEPNAYTFEISGFSEETIHIYDISDPAQPVRLVNGVIDQPASAYRIRVEDDVARDARYLALAEGQKRAPAGLLLDTPSAWKSPDNGADYIIITHEDFAAAVARLADHRASQGLRVATVNITDVYDEFGAGVFDPRAVRDFLSYAFDNWKTPAPLYVLLVGDANYDYQDYLGTGNPNFVPTVFFESTLLGQTTTDNWFVSVSGDDPLPDMFLGRLSVRTPGQAEAVVDKILAYEQNSLPAAWHQKVISVADDECDEIDGELVCFFEDYSDELMARLPSNYTAHPIYASTFPEPYDPTADIVSAVDEGALILNYIGHGAVGSWGLWSGGVIFDTLDVPLLQNEPRYPFLITGNCRNGLFAYPTGDDAFAETWLNFEGGGGIGAWSPTGQGYPYWHQRMAEHLFDAFFGDAVSSDPIYALGPATTRAKIEGFAELGRVEPVEIFTLFGDPASALHIVQPGLSLAKTATPSQVKPGHLITYVLTYGNSGKYSAENVVLTEGYDPHTAFVSANPPPTTGDNVWAIGTLQPGESSTISLTLKVSDTVRGGTTVRNTATLSANEVLSRTATTETVVEYFRTFVPLMLRELTE